MSDRTLRRRAHRRAHLKLLAAVAIAAGWVMFFVLALYLWAR